MLNRFLMPCVITAVATVAHAQEPARLVPSTDVYVTTLGSDVREAKVLNGEGTLTTSPVPGGTLLGRDAVRLQIAVAAKPAEFWVNANVPLRPDVQRVSFWAFSRGIAWSETRAVMQDPKGIVRTYKAQAVGDSPWTLYHLPIRSLGQPISELERVAGDGQWHFRGLTLRYQPFVKGGVTLGELSTSTKAQPVGMPDDSWSFRDIDESVIHQAAFTGFRFSYEATTLPASVPMGLMISPARQASTMQWQLRSMDGTIVDAGEHALRKPLAADAASLDFNLPTLPAANYWLRVKLRGDAGDLLAEYDASYLVHRSQRRSLDVSSPAPRQRPFDNFWPALAEVNLDVDAASSEPITVPMANGAAGEVVRWKWRNAASETVGEGQATRSAGESTLSVPLPTVALVGPQRYRLTLQLVRDDKPLDARIANVYARANAVPFTAGGKSPERHFSLKETDMRSIRADQRQNGTDFSKNAAQNKSHAFMTFYWDEIEPRKGFIQFPPMDERIGTAVEAGVGVVPTLAVHLDRLPRWMWYPVMLDQGLQSRHYNATFTRKPSPASKDVRDALANSARQIVRHYKQSPAIVGWNFTQGVESFWSDASRNGFVVDFSRAASAAFSERLQRKGWKLADVATALERRLDGWQDVTPPLPQFTGQLDLRPIWLEWESFKQTVPGENFASLLSAVREEDKERPIFIYAGMGAGDLTTYAAPFVQHHGTICFGGGDASISPFLESLALGAGVDFDAESAAVPPFQPQLLTTIFHKLSHGSTRGGTNIMWGRFFSATSEDHVNGSRAASRWVDVIDRIGPSVPVWSDVAVGVGSLSMINRTRSFMWIDWMNLPEAGYGFADMITQTVPGNAQVGYVTDNTPLDQLQKFPAIVFMEAPLISDDAAARLNDYVRGGGNLVLQGETGRYNERGEENWTIKSLLSIAPDGASHGVGKGTVQWHETADDWRKAGTLDRLASHIGYRMPASADRSDVRHALRRSADGKSYFLVLFRKTWPTGNPKLEQLKGQAERVLASVNALPVDTRWTLTNLVDDASMGERSSAELSQGITLDMKPADMVILRLDPK